MENLDPILFGDDDRPGDAEARSRARRWSTLMDVIRADVDAAVQDRRLLILEGMRRFGGDDFLPESDAQELKAASEPLASAMERHPALEDVVEDVRRDCALFDHCWLEAFSGSATRRGRAAADRAPAVRARRTGFRWVWRIGAGMAVLAFSAIVYFLAQRGEGLTTLATGPGETVEITLADGSAVRLLPNSELQYHEPGDETSASRYARLTGDAYFEIAPQREGFTIDLPTAAVVVLGTTFGIQADDQEASVYLASGRVSVVSRAARDRAVVLEPGQSTSVARSAAPTPPQTMDITQALEWTGLLVFRETPVSVVADRLSDVFDAQVNVDPRLADETVSGTFDRADGLEIVVEAVAAALDAKVTRSSEGIHTLSPQ